MDCISLGLQQAGADPRFLERGFICIKLWGFSLFSLISIWSHRILKTGGGGEGGPSEPPEPPLDPPLAE